LLLAHARLHLQLSQEKAALDITYTASAQRRDKTICEYKQQAETAAEHEKSLSAQLASLKLQHECEVSTAASLRSEVERLASHASELRATVARLTERVSEQDGQLDGLTLDCAAKDDALAEARSAYESLAGQHKALLSQITTAMEAKQRGKSGAGSATGGNGVDRAPHGSGTGAFPSAAGPVHGGGLRLAATSSYQSQLAMASSTAGSGGKPSAAVSNKGRAASGPGVGTPTMYAGVAGSARNTANAAGGRGQAGGPQMAAAARGSARPQLQPEVDTEDTAVRAHKRARVAGRG
jgi:hypothetical protein